MQLGGGPRPEGRLRLNQSCKDLAGEMVALINSRTWNHQRHQLSRHYYSFRFLFDCTS